MLSPCTLSYLKPLSFFHNLLYKRLLFSDYIDWILRRGRITEGTLRHRKVSQLSPRNSILIIYFLVRVKSLFEYGKNYPWQAPDNCPYCRGRRLWGHGFVQRCFSGFIQKVWVKKYRCPDCGRVHTMRPDTHWSRFHTSMYNILKSLLCKISYSRWKRYLPRQSQQYWFKGLIFQSSRFMNTLHLTSDVVLGLISRSIIPPSHSIHCECLRV